MALVPERPNAAVVVATAHDSPTVFVAHAAHEVVRLGRERGLRVLSFLEHEAKLDRVYSGLYALHREPDHPRPLLGFFSAHGSDQGLHEAPTQQEPAGP